MNTTLEERLIIPESLSNNFTIGDFEFHASIYDLKFESSSIKGKLLFEKYSGSNSPEYSAELPEVTLFDRPVTSPVRTNGYRSQLVGTLANQGIIISDFVLNRVFTDIDEELRNLYLKAFPDNSRFTGRVKEAKTHLESGWNHAGILYEMEDRNGIIYRVGIESEVLDQISKPPQVGDLVEVHFDYEHILARIETNVAVDIGTTVNVIKQATHYYSITSYEIAVPDRVSSEV